MCGAPGRELGAGLQHGVRRRLGDETRTDGKVLLSAEQQGQRRGGDRMAGQVLGDPAEAVVPFVDHDVAQREPTVRNRFPGDPDDDEGQARPNLRQQAPRIRQPTMKIDDDGTGPLRGDRAAQLGQEGFGAEGLKDRETLPCRQCPARSRRCPITGWSAGRRAAPWR